MTYLTVAPNGISASLASLNCCSPNGIPMTVMQSRHPIVTCSIASGIPDTSSHIMFTRRETVPPPYSTSFPNGKKERLANLKHCTPTGTPTIVIHQRIPAKIQLTPLTKPPKINHNKFPKHPIFLSFLSSTFLFTLYNSSNERFFYMI